MDERDIADDLLDEFGRGFERKKVERVIKIMRSSEDVTLIKVRMHPQTFALALTFLSSG